MKFRTNLELDTGDMLPVYIESDELAAIFPDDLRDKRAVMVRFAQRDRIVTFFSESHIEHENTRPGSVVYKNNFPLCLDSQTNNSEIE